MFLNKEQHKSRLVREVVGLFWAFVGAILIQIIFVQPFYVPSGSMYPTLEVGDYLLTTKPTYGYSMHSVPFSLIPFKGRIWDSPPQRGQIVVFSGVPADDRTFIKRLIGMPGDRIQMKDGILYINGEACKLERIADYTLLDPRHPDNVQICPQYLRTLPGGVTHPIIKFAPFGSSRLDNTEELTVPEKHYFMMGDNQDGSDDSRNLKGLGFIHEDNLIGPARLLWFSTTAKWYEPHKWVTGLRLERFFTWLK